MKEGLLHFIWKYRLLKGAEFKTKNGKTLRILSPGEANRDAGPDFFNAIIELDGLKLAGNVEIHIRSSDWLKHGHQNDPSYDHLILHAVYRHDVKLAQNALFNVEVLEMKDYIGQDVIRTYEKLMSAGSTVCCAAQIGRVPAIKLDLWLQRMLTERLEEKTRQLKELFQSTGNDYGRTFYFLLARNFGFKINALPFELLARHLPLPLLLRHQQSLFQLEALLYGTAGFLEEQLTDDHGRQLQNEFEFLRSKLNIKPLPFNIWKFMRLRPASFPSVRLWQFASVLHHAPGLFSDPPSFASAGKLGDALSHPHPGYWRDHYRIDGPKTKPIPGMGADSVHNILINTMAPYLFFFGKQTGNEGHCEAALRCFEEIPFENNRKTRLYTAAGLKPANGGQSQALINLHDNYCVPRACLQCSVASSLLLNT